MSIEISNWELPKYRANISVKLSYNYIRLISITNKGNSLWCIEKCGTHEHRNKSEDN